MLASSRIFSERYGKTYIPGDHEDHISENGMLLERFSHPKQEIHTSLPFLRRMSREHCTPARYVLALQDILIRWRRMQGRSALWVPGTDHAAIATESVVLRNLGIQDRNKEISREDFLKEAEKWTEKRMNGCKSNSKMGASCDWTREAYTLTNQEIKR